MFSFFTHPDERRIILISALTLTTLILLAGFSVYKIMQPKPEAMVASGLKIALENMAQLIENQITHAISHTKTASANASLIQNLGKTSNGLKDKNFTELILPSEKTLSNHFSNIDIYDSEGNLIWSSGRKSSYSSPAIQIDTHSGTRSDLLWNEQFILRNSMPILDDEKNSVGQLVTEEPLPALTKIFTEITLVGTTGSFLLCASTKENVSEIDCFMRKATSNHIRIQRVISNEPLPIHYALEGKSGIKSIRDYRQIKVIAAHSPIAYGLGAVLKINEQELFGNLEDQLQTILLYLAVFVAFGVAILYWVTLPLIQKSLKSRNALIRTHKELIHARNYAEQVSSELTSYINTLGKIALIFFMDDQGKIVQANDKLCEISGYTQEELIGQEHRLLNSQEHPEPFFIDMWGNISAGKIWHQEICNRSKGGTLYWINSVIIPLVNRHGEIDRYLSVSVDITAHKQRDRDLSERIKENNCLLMTRKHLEENASVLEICQKILESFIAALPYPEMAVVLIKIGNQQIATADYKENISDKISATIVSNGEICGLLQLSYLRNFPFTLPYEQNLINAIAHDLGQWYERKEAEQRIIRMATHDTLTGLPNWYLLQDRIEQALVHDTRYQRQMAVLFIDLDHFKTVNDSLGHDFGDLLLKAVAERLLVCVRSEDTVARQGGDEFIVVLNSIAMSLDAAKVAQKILDSLTLPYWIQENELHINGSIGIAVFPEDGNSVEALLKNSNMAMYHAKANGRNNYQFFTHELNKSAHERHILSLDLRRALERDELVLYYQPVVNVPGNKLHSVEALLRWRHPEQKLIAPDKFISLAEETGLIIPIGEWVIRTVCMQIKNWQSHGYIAPRVAINLSGRQFRDNELIAKISCILEETGVEAKYIALEITESMLIDNIEKVVETLECLSKMGIHISIDDFGTGYSSLSYLKRFPIHTLKIDRSFIRDIVTDKNDRAIVTAIIAMAHNLEMEVTAEGIEEKEQLNLLMVQQCNHYQGYYFSKPIPVVEVESMLEKSATNLCKTSAIHVAK
jgi:diguanylate cyclase (GGDEF)-like protein/PAS domain S-box-containing protein